MARALSSPHNAGEIVNSSRFSNAVRAALVITVVAISLVIYTISKTPRAEADTSSLLEFDRNAGLNHERQFAGHVPDQKINENQKLVQIANHVNPDSSVVIIHNKDGTRRRSSGHRTRSVVKKFKGMIGKSDGTSPAWAEDDLPISEKSQIAGPTTYGPSDHPPQMPTSD